MRRVMLLLVAMLSLSSAAAAQNNAAMFALIQPAAAAASPQGFDISDSNWQLAVGYQYNRLRFGTTTINTHGLNTSLVRFLGGGFGLEVDLGSGFRGNTGASTIPPNLSLKSVFLGGGAHMSFSRESSLEPWVHAVVGVEHFRLTQTAGASPTANSVAYILGGGVDLHMNGRTAIRLQTDYLGTRFNSATQKNFQVVVGLVFNL